jgi:hypothetical protein
MISFACRQLGGVWEAPGDYSFMATTNTQTNVVLLKKFGDWMYNDRSLEQRMPWVTTSNLACANFGSCQFYNLFCNLTNVPDTGLLTTSASCNSSWFGTCTFTVSLCFYVSTSNLVSVVAGGINTSYVPAPYMECLGGTCDATSVAAKPVTIWFWMREFYEPPVNRTTSCRGLQAAGFTASGVYTIDPSGFNQFKVYCDFEQWVETFLFCLGILLNLPLICSTVMEAGGCCWSQARLIWAGRISTLSAATHLSHPSLRLSPS